VLRLLLLLLLLLLAAPAVVDMMPRASATRGKGSAANEPSESQAGDTRTTATPRACSHATSRRTGPTNRRRRPPPPPP
jgi:hypothetical protein